MAPFQLRDRDRELSDLAEFATGGVGYRWLVGGPWTGKTALAATFCAASRDDDVDVVAYFLVRPRGDADAARFLQVVNE